MERAVAAFIVLAAGSGFAYGLLFTEARFVPALGGGAIFGAAAIFLAGVGSMLVHGVRWLMGRGLDRMPPPRQSGPTRPDR